ncbi:MAG: FixH family protein [Saprospiraceae bacterium]|nr:FixH family protein [Saprospiraceae bacterium]MDW8483466.1 FixH family protein [Saprospiraceae bacterium]
MKLNWGIGIALFYSAFVVTMLIVVFRSRAHDPVMVSKNYYELDLNYQAHLEKKQHAAALGTPLVARYDVGKGAFLLLFPQKAGKPTGKVKCFRAATTRDDRWFDIQTDEQGIMEIPAADFVPGRWHLEADWQGADGTSYFHELVVVR